MDENPADRWKVHDELLCKACEQQCHTCRLSHDLPELTFDHGHVADGALTLQAMPWEE